MLVAPVPNWPTITNDVSTGRLLVSVMVKPLPVGTVINTGDQPAPGATFNAAHLAVLPVTAAPQVYPHIGIAWPSGRSAGCLWAVKWPVWAEDPPAINRRMAAASAAVFIIAFRSLDRMAQLLLVRAFRR